MADTQLTPIDQFKGIINSQTIKAQVKNSMKENSGAFLSSMIDLYSGDTQLQKCDPEKVAMECVKAAALNLPLVKSLGFAYVVPYKNVPTFTIGYKGLIQLAQRTRQYESINADCVYEGELLGFDKLSGMINLNGTKTSDNVIGYFAYFKLLNGFQKVLYMTKEEVEDWGKKYSPSYNSNYSPWKTETEFDKMALKTCLRRLISGYGPMDHTIQRALESDDRGTTPAEEIKVKANKTMIDIDPATGEVVGDVQESQSAEEKPSEPVKPPFMS